VVVSVFVVTLGTSGCRRGFQRRSPGSWRRLESCATTAVCVVVAMMRQRRRRDSMTRSVTTQRLWPTMIIPWYTRCTLKGGIGRQNDSCTRKSPPSLLSQSTVLVTIGFWTIGRVRDHVVPSSSSFMLSAVLFLIHVVGDSVRLSLSLFSSLQAAAAMAFSGPNADDSAMVRCGG
jgi:hypothetical protein